MLISNICFYVEMVKKLLTYNGCAQLLFVDPLLYNKHVITTIVFILLYY